MPTWRVVGSQPLSQAIREPPTAPLRNFAASSNCLNPSASPIPRPPDTITSASSSFIPSSSSVTLSRTVTREEGSSSVHIYGNKFPLCRVLSFRRCQGFRPHRCHLGEILTGIGSHGEPPVYRFCAYKVFVCPAPLIAQHNRLQ